MRADFGDTLRFWADRGVDGFRIDVAHGLRKDLSEPYAPWGEIADLMREDGSGTATTFTRSMPIGGGSSTPTNRPATQSRRLTYIRGGERGTPQPTVSGMRSTSTCKMRIGEPTNIAV